MTLSTLRTSSPPLTTSTIGAEIFNNNQTLRTQTLEAFNTSGENGYTNDQRRDIRTTLSNFCNLAPNAITDDSISAVFRDDSTRRLISNQLSWGSYFQEAILRQIPGDSPANIALRNYISSQITNAMGYPTDFIRENPEIARLLYPIIFRAINNGLPRQAL